MSGNYLDAIAIEIGDRCGMDMFTPADRDLLRRYAVLCTTVGVSVANEHVHDAWSSWWLANHKEGEFWHPCLVPYDALPHEKQALDTPYRDAIRAVAQARRNAPEVSV